MFLIKLIRYLKGYIIFTASGGFIERMMNLAARNGVSLWDYRRTGEYFTGCTTISSFNKLLEIAEKANVHIDILETRGLFKKAEKYKKRSGLITGLVIFVLVLSISSKFIWEIRIEGAENINKQAILDNLERYGLEEGCYKKNIDAETLENKMKIAMDDISWIAVNITGSTAIIKVMERADVPEMIDNNIPCNVIAKDSGIITYMEVYDGKPMVQIGDCVAKGDILVSGIINDPVNNSYTRQARALVKATTTKKCQFSFPLSQTLLVPTNKTVNKKRIKIIKKEFDINKEKIPEGEYTHRRIKNGVSLFNLALPIYVITDQYMPLEEKTIEVTQEKARELAEIEMEKYESSLSLYCDILQKEAVATVKDNEIIVFCRYVCEKNIAVSKEILQKDNTI